MKMVLNASSATAVSWRFHSTLWHAGKLAGILPRLISGILNSFRNDPMQTTNPLIYLMHSAYCEAINFRIILTLERQRELEALIARGVTLEDFKLVLRWLNLKIAKGERNLGALRWSNLVWDAGRFEEELAMAKAEQRNRPASPSVKDKWVKKPLDTARPVAALLPDISALVKAAHEACEKG